MAELVDRAGIFVGETAEAFADMEYTVMRDPARLAFARRVMTETMQGLVDRYTARSADSTANRRTKNYARRS